MDNLIEIVVAKIPYGKENAVSRSTLSSELGITDRKVRAAIAEANKRGIAIVSLDGKRGYFQPETMDEKYAYCKRERSRAISIFEKLSPIYAELKEAGYKI